MIKNRCVGNVETRRDHQCHQSHPGNGPLLLDANATTYTRGMRERPSSRLLILDGENRILLFRFEHKRGPLAGQAYWATPGGGVDPGESFEEAACREMLEETGLGIDDPGPQVARREASFQLPTGEMVTADERFFLIRIHDLEVSADNWTQLEHDVMSAYRWWSHADLKSTTDQIWPETLTEMLIDAGAWKPVE
jgi:8-oxo-dGTP pyrophosphatase MutT (NUDIX family)